MLDDAVLHAQALHVLAADVEDELNAGEHFLGTPQVRDGLDLSAVCLDGLEQQALAVPGDRGVPDAHQRVALLVAGDVGPQLAEHAAAGAQHVALVRGVEGLEELAVLADERALEGGGTGVDAQVGHAAVAGELAPPHGVLGMALLEGAVVLLVPEQGVEAHDLAALDVSQSLQAALDLAQGEGLLVLGAGDGGAAGDEEMAVLRLERGLRPQLEGLDKAGLELAEVVERAAEEGHVAVDGAAARQAGDSLRHYRLEDRGGDVLLLRTLVEQGLHVGLGEHAASRCDGVDDGVVLCQLIEARGVCVEQACHLVDEGARATGAGAVHALLDAAVEVDDLGILSAELDGNVCLGDEGLDGVLVCDDLLDEGHLEPAGEQQAATAGDGHRRGNVSHLGQSLFDDLDDRGADIRVVPAVHGEAQLVAAVEGEELDCRGANVDTDAEHVARENGHRAAFQRVAPGCSRARSEQ